MSNIYFFHFKDWKKTYLFTVVIILFSSCLGNFSHNKNENIIGEYYIIATDVKSQANISIYKKKYKSYIGITPEGITEYSIINKKYIIGKNYKNSYFIVKIGEEASKEVNFKEFDKFLNSENTISEKVNWKKI